MAGRLFSYSGRIFAIVNGDGFISYQRCACEIFDEIADEKKRAVARLLFAVQELLLAICCVLELFAALLDVLAGAGKGVAACQWHGECKSDGDECG